MPGPPSAPFIRKRASAAIAAEIIHIYQHGGAIDRGVEDNPGCAIDLVVEAAP